MDRKQDLVLCQRGGQETGSGSGTGPKSRKGRLDLVHGLRGGQEAGSGT